MSSETEQDKPAGEAITSMVHKGYVILAKCEIEDMPTFKCRDDDVWVCSFPRSGTTLTQQIVYLIMTQDVEKGRTVQLDDRFPIADLLDPSYPYFRGLKYLDTRPETSPRFIKSHLPYTCLPEQLKSGKGKIIFITRNPKASAVSHYKLSSYLKMFDGDLRKYVEEFLEGKTIAGTPWDKQFRTYWEHRDDPNVLFIQFETLIKDRRTMIAKIAGFLGKDLSPAELDTVYQETTLESMKTNNAVNWMYIEEKFAVDKSQGGLINTGETSGWRRDLPQDLAERLDQLIQQATADTDIVYE